VTIITHIHQPMHKLYVKSHIIHTHELSLMFTQQIAVFFRQTLIQRNIKLMHKISIYNI